MMNLKKIYVYLILIYVFVLLYIILENNPITTSILVVVLFIGNVYIVANVRKDLSQDKQASVKSLMNRLDESKKQSEETYKQFLSLSKTLGSGVLMVNEDGIITFSNKDVENYFSFDLNNKDYNTIVDIKPLYQFINKAYLLEETFRQQIVYQDRYYDLISTPLFDEDMFAGCLILIHDISLIKTAEHFQKQFTADVSHELKTPLSVIKGFSEILNRDEVLSEKEQKEFLGLINKESSRMESILNDLLIISKLDRLDYEMDLVKLDIKDVIMENMTLLESRILEKNLTSEINIEPCFLLLDKLKFSQVMINLVSNAINYTDQGFINISGFIEDHQYIIKVTDSGIGINEADYDKIFKRFYRVDKTRSRDTGGSGLGLSISKNVILKHNGTLTVESTLGRGSAFVIALPIENH